MAAAVTKQLSLSHYSEGFPGGSAVKNLPANAGDADSIPGCERSLGEEGNPLHIPVGKSNGQRSLAGYSLWGCERVRHDLATKQQQHFSDEATHQETLQDFFQ